MCQKEIRRIHDIFSAKTTVSNLNYCWQSHTEAVMCDTGIPILYNILSVLLFKNHHQRIVRIVQTNAATGQFIK